MVKKIIKTNPNLIELINKLNTAKDNSTRKSFFNATNVTLSQTLCL